jgi:hypothetical protein
VRTKKK